MSGIVWLASYPKSGNTWLRVFLANWISGLDEPVSINELARYGLGFQDTDKPVWQAVCGRIPPFEEQAPFRAEIQRAFPRWVTETLGGSGGPLLVKTHSARALLRGYPTIAPDMMTGAIYLVRDPRKVAPSFARYYGYSPEETVRLMNDPSATIDGHGIEQYVSSWSAHVTSWERVARVIRYEDLPDAFEAVISYLGLPKDERFARALAFSRLEELSAQEEREGYAANLRENPFFGGRNAPFPEELLGRITADHGAVMRKYGYH